VKLADLERHLRQHGCTFFREGSAHTIWRNPSNRKITSVPRHREIKEGTVHAICKQLEIPRP
jgi:predicted RNA binding protein YcfA (HicA-like mRNA interferase family)